MSSHKTRIATTVLALLTFGPAILGQSWPDIFDPLVLRTLNLQMSNEDWQTIQQDETFEIEVPTLLWLAGEQPILVSIRRKSADPLTASPNYRKVSYKIDINELMPGQNWHGLRAISLDNGDDQDVVSEGLAWYLHRRASGPEGYGYNAGLASWVRLVINGIDTGVYVNAEQRDKRFLENRGLWVDDETWLYEVEDIHGVELDEGEGDSPTYLTLCYSPFRSPSTCATPAPATLATVLPTLVDMRGLLALAAVDAISANPDAIFTHGKNFYFADYLSGQRRLYFPWDLDSAMRGGGVNQNIYAAQSAYSQILLAVPQFRAQYSQILNDLVCGPLAAAQLHSFIDALEPVLSAALAADPNNQLGGQSVGEFFDGRKTWISNRLASVRAQIEGFSFCAVPLGPPCASGSCVTCPMVHRLANEPTLGSSTFALDLLGAESGTLAWVVLTVGTCGSPGLSIPGWCGPLLTAPTVLGAIGPVSPTGGTGCAANARFSLPLPPIPGLAGLPIASQCFVFCPAASGGTSLSNCLSWHLQGN